MRRSGLGVRPASSGRQPSPTAYVAGSPVGFQIERDVIPEPVPVTSDGQIQVVTSFQHRGATTPANRWVAVGLLYHPNGDAADTRNAQLLLVGPLPSDLY